MKLLFHMNIDCDLNIKRQILMANCEIFQNCKYLLINASTILVNTLIGFYNSYIQKLITF